MKLAISASRKYMSSYADKAVTIPTNPKRAKTGHLQSKK